MPSPHLVAASATRAPRAVTLTPAARRPPPRRRAPARSVSVSASASAARGPHAVPVPLPTTGPLAPPDDVREAVRAWPWRGGLEPCAERPVAPLPPDAIRGVIPPDLNGTFYRVGPGRVRVGARRYAHWFDGDGACFAIRLDGEAGAASAGVRMVRTDRYVAQERAGVDAGVAVRGAWTQADDLFANLGRFPTNPGNTAPMFHAGRFLALCEGGAPVELDPITLETRGVFEFGPELPMGFSAHAKRDSRDGTLYTWGLAKPPAIGFKVAKIDASGAVEKVADLPLPGPGPRFTLIHDCAMSENHLVFIVPPWKLEPGGKMAAALLGASSFGHAFEWDDGAGAWMIVVRKSDLSVAHAREIPSMSTYHFAGAYETNADGSKSNGAPEEIRVLVNELIGRRDDLEARFADMYSAEWAPDGYNLLSEYTVRMRDGALVSKSPVVPRVPGGGEDVSVASAGQLPMEFPVIAPGARRRKPRFVYTLGFAGSGSGYFDAVQRLDVRDGGTHQTRIMPPGVFPSEVEFVPRRDARGDVRESEEDRGYLIYLEYHAARHQSDVVVLDAADVAGKELARIKLPFHVPHTFHGTFRADRATR